MDAESMPLRWNYDPPDISCEMISQSIIASYNTKSLHRDGNVKSS